VSADPFANEARCARPDCDEPGRYLITHLPGDRAIPPWAHVGERYCTEDTNELLMDVGQVRATLVADEPRCDFCAGADPRWALHTDRVFMDMVVETDDGMVHITQEDFGEDWAVCDECKPLLEAKDMDGLMAHATAQPWEPRNEAGELAEEVAAAVDGFRRNLWGTVFAGMHLPIEEQANG
jgi:hypothetical protein